jgi:hypothetical protein
VIIMGTHYRMRAQRRQAMQVGHCEWGSSQSEKMKNRGKEAKKWLKKNDMTFFSGANDVRFACELAQIAR